VRRALTLVLAATLAGAPAHAVPKPQIVDPSGDAVTGASYDIVSATFSTARTGRRPTKLVVKVAYAGDVTTDPYAAQVVRFVMPECGAAYLEVYAGTTYGTADCVDDAFTFGVRTSGRTLTLTLPFAAVGTSYLGPGVELTALGTWTTVAEPTSGAEPGDLAGTAVTLDLATTDKTYTIR